MSTELEVRGKADALADNLFGILSRRESQENKLARIANLVPVALEVEYEARETIARLRTALQRIRNTESSYRSWQYVDMQLRSVDE